MYTRPARLGKEKCLAQAIAVWQVLLAFVYAGISSADGLEILIDEQQKHDLLLGCCNVSYQLQQHCVTLCSAQQHDQIVQMVKA